MDQTIYKIRLKEFENKYREVLVDMFKELSGYWKKYPIKYNHKIDMDYTSFVKYCYRVTDIQYNVW